MHLYALLKQDKRLRKEPEIMADAKRHTIKVTFTLDTICPYTYLGRRGLQLAGQLARLDSAAAAELFKDIPGLDTAADLFPLPVDLDVIYRPYYIAKRLPKPSARALGPAAAPATNADTATGPYAADAAAATAADADADEGIDKHAWYLSKFHGDGAHFGKMQQTMSRLAAARGVVIVYDGRVGHTEHAHRVIHHLQHTLKLPNDEVEAFMDALYALYFTESRHPSSYSTLAAALQRAGLQTDWLAAYLASDADKEEVAEQVQEAMMAGIDGVPHVVFEGRRRDLTLVGNKEPAEYLRAMVQVLKEL